MSAKKQSTYTAKERTRREAALVNGLERMRRHDPDAFAEMMKLLARLVVESKAARREKQVA